MPALVELEGTDGKPIEFKRFCHTVNQHMVDLRKFGIATSAGDNGAINIWKDDEGYYRSQRMVHRVPKSAIKVRTQAEIRLWLEVNFPLTQ